jgi:hypothetical protein
MRDLLLRLQRALPQVEQWVKELHTRHALEAVPVGEMGFQRLESYLPVDLLQRARAVTIPRIPFPPVSAYGLPEFEQLAQIPMAGITFDDMYFVHPAHASEGVHFHELVHVIQWGALGVRTFLVTYAVGIAQYGYVESPLEAVAYDLQARFEQQAMLPAIVDFVERHAVAARAATATVFREHGLEMGA